MTVKNLDYVLDRHGVISTVIGYSHPSGYLFSYPTYYPHTDGNRKFRGMKYKKFKRETDTMNFINPAMLSMEFSYPSVLIPEDDIEQIFVPVNELYDQDGVMSILADVCGIAPGFIGLMGSKLIGIESETSDTDIVIAGRDNVRNFLNSQSVLFRRLQLETPTNDTIESYAQRYADYHNFPLDESKRLFREDKTKVYRSGKKFSFILNYTDDEVPEALKMCNTQVRGSVETTATVVDASNGVMYPRHYVVAINGVVYDVVTHHWFFKSAAKSGNMVRIHGNLREGNLITLDQRNHYILRV